MTDRPTAKPQARARNRPTADDYFQGIRDRNLSMLARAFTLVESSSPRHQKVAEELLTRLMPLTGNALRIGITGAPGAGKSTFIEAFGLLLVRQGKRVAVLAVDPSSGVSGGSILGDKTRMTNLSSEKDAFIRPSPSAGTLGGVAHKTRECMLIAEAAGFDVILIETVGVGQSETMVADMTDCFLGLMLPGAGDELQGIKRGLLELVDVIAVNKADGKNKDAAELAARQYHNALDSITGRHFDDAPAILTCSARENLGIDKVWKAIEKRCRLRKDSGDFQRRRQQQNLRWLWSIVEDQLRHVMHTHPAVQAICNDVETNVLDGSMPPAAGARRLFSALNLDSRNL
ncbi:MULTISPECIES: methylmalonyl Co-A mutase-associated GTPase MeaB [Crateriforma]|uniref:Putative GTPase ArgK n=1 Tax=Crateriforma conspicua TaxID=2527996 RepID=A0A5C6FRZ9_9PLAN|nr:MULTISPECIES: methylmalonyl Co-A mutase-associated GTPase MeaB [Crateriforma]TWU65867.1 putative GTPase ArgK [Crateriforma conspicua]